MKTEWDDVAGLTEVKRDVELNLLGAMQRPELFTGLLQPARGILFYGPPGAIPASPLWGGWGPDWGAYHLTGVGGLLNPNLRVGLGFRP